MPARPKKKAAATRGKIDKLVAQADARAASAGIEIEAEAYTLEWYRADWPARKRDFIEREIKIRNAFNRNRLEDFILNDAQSELYYASLESSEDPSLEDFTLKCRRLGISSYYIADYLADAVVLSGQHVRIVAQDPDTLKALFKVIRGMYDNLREEIRPRANYNSETALEFNDPEKGVTGSRISVSTVVPGQEQKGRGDTITRLHMTEIPFWKGNPDEAADALCEAAAGGKQSGESTPKGVGDWFWKKYDQGKRRQGGIRSHFFPWWWNKNYQVAGYSIIQGSDNEWFLLRKSYVEKLGVRSTGVSGRVARLSDEDREKARITTYSAQEREKNGLLLQSEYDCAQQILAFLKSRGHVEQDAEWWCDDVAARIQWRREKVEKKGKSFRVEYPENDEECFAATGGAIFDQSYLKIKSIYREAEPGHTYKVFLDPSNGVEGGDPACITVIDRDTGEQVYEWDGIRKQDDQAAMCCELSDKYNMAEIGIEANMGEAAILEVERLGYGARLYKHVDAQTERDIADGKLTYREAWKKAKPGIQLTDRLKRVAVNKFEQAWRRSEFKCASEGLISEARVFVQDGEKMGAKSGHHDDRVMANAECWYLVENSLTGGPAEFRSTGVKLDSVAMSGY